MAGDPHLGHLQDKWVENRDRFHFLDWDDYSLVAVSMRSEQSCKPPGYKGARPSLAMGSRIPTPNHHTIRQYMPVIKRPCLSWLLSSDLGSYTPQTDQL